MFGPSLFNSILFNGSVATGPVTLFPTVHGRISPNGVDPGWSTVRQNGVGAIKSRIRPSGADPGFTTIKPY